MRPATLLPRVRLHRPGLDFLTVLCVGLVAVQVGMSLLGDSARADWVYWQFGLSREGVLSGKVWQLATHPLLHGGWLHLLFNWLVIFLIGGRIHRILGGRVFARIFVGGVLLGSVLHLVLQPDKVIPGDLIGSPPLVGASAGALALLLTLTGLSPDSRMWPLPVSGKNLGRGLLASMLLLFLITPGLGIPVLSGFGGWLAAHGMEGLFRIGHIYHFGGALVGVLSARRLLRRPVSLGELRRQRARREGIAA